MNTIGFLLVALGALIAFEALKNLHAAGASAGSGSSGSSSASSGTRTNSIVNTLSPQSYSLPTPQLDADISAAAQLAGAPSSWLPYMKELILGHENASADPTAVNPQAVSNGEYATGLTQTIPSTFNAYAVPGHADIFNPVDNIAASFRYIAANYGNIANICYWSNPRNCAGY